MITISSAPTVDATTATMTDRALAATADRALRTAVAMDRPVLADDDLVVAWQGDRGVFTNIAVVLAADPDWDALVARVGERRPRRPAGTARHRGDDPGLARPGTGTSSAGRP